MTKTALYEIELTGSGLCRVHFFGVVYFLYIYNLYC